MKERLLGVETEYAANVGSSVPGDTHRQDALWRLMALAKQELPHLRDFGEGIFLGNGSRFYIDCGMHPEFTTPECADPWEVVRYILAGERILVDLAAKFAAAPGGQVVDFFKCNVDYSGAGTTWGCHESYLHRAHPSLLSDQIIPHLVSRVIYTGAGGFDPLSAGLKFTISPRASHLRQVLSENSTSERGIFHTKDESLASEGFHRLHLICGESLCSETAMWLKVATTALVVAMSEACINLDVPVRLSDPVQALMLFAGDPTCRAKLRLANGRMSSAIDIQRFYLSRAEEHAHQVFMPVWTKEVCRQWGLMLDRLEAGADGVKTILDWGIKLALYQDFARRQGVEWESLPHWSLVYAGLSAALERVGAVLTISVSSLLDRNSPVREEVKRLDPYLRDNGLSWDGLGRFLRLRKQLFEIDTRFGQLGDKGIFAELSRGGVLSHSMQGVGDVSEAVEHPPPSGRARLRGEFIRRVSAAGRKRYECDWQGIWDRVENRVLDLSHPFTVEARWLDVSDAPLERLDRIPQSILHHIRYADAGRYY